MTATKANTYRIYITEENTALMKRICEVTELGNTELLSKIVGAGLRCISENANRVPLPLRFRISEEASGESRLTSKRER